MNVLLLRIGYFWWDDMFAAGFPRVSSGKLTKTIFAKFAYKNKKTNTIIIFIKTVP